MTCGEGPGLVGTGPERRSALGHSRRARVAVRSRGRDECVIGFKGQGPERGSVCVCCEQEGCGDSELDKGTGLQSGKKWWYSEEEGMLNGREHRGWARFALHWWGWGAALWGAPGAGPGLGARMWVLNKSGGYSGVPDLQGPPLPIPKKSSADSEM